MRRKIIFIALFTIIMTIFFNTAVFAEVNIKLPERLSALFEAIKTISPIRPDNITINLYGKEMTIIDFSYYEKHRDTIHVMIRALMYPYLLFFHYDKLCSLLHGSPFTTGSFSTGSSLNLVGIESKSSFKK